MLVAPLFISAVVPLVRLWLPESSLLYAAGACAVGLVLWFVLAPGPRRRRAYRRAVSALARNDWRSARALVARFGAGERPGPWRTVEGESCRLAGEEALAAGRYEEARDAFAGANRLLGRDAAEGSRRVTDAALEDVRRAVGQGNVDGVRSLVGRVLAWQPDSAEAHFWQAWAHRRRGDDEQALQSLRAAHAADGGLIDPPLYLGALLLRSGQAAEAVRHLAEANRLAPESPLVAWQLGSAILAAEGEALLAARALRRARADFARLGGGGMRAVWAEGLPEGRSLIRRLALGHAFACPVFGDSPAALGREAELSLGEALSRAGHFAEAVEVYEAMLREAPPTVPVLRGLGRALARLGRYEEAYKHLRIAYENQEPKDAFTAGYLALCGARGKAPRPEDRARNLAWALGVLAQFDRRGDREWAELAAAVHAEARAAGVAVPAADVHRLADVLASVDATDAGAAGAYEELWRVAPEAFRPEHAFLYVRAVETAGQGSEHELDVLMHAFADRPALDAFYRGRGWDPEGAEFAFLARQAARHPGHFPAVLGSDYAARGEALLLERSRRLERDSRPDEAARCVAILLALWPRNPRALDRSAELAYRRGDLGRAADALRQWHETEPASALPFVRLAMLEQRRGDAAALVAAVEQALARATAAERPVVAYLGARLAVVHGLGKGTGQIPAEVETWLRTCLELDPGHAEARACLAAVRVLRGDRAGLASMAGALRDSTLPLGRYLAACAALAAADAGAALDAAGRAAADPLLADDAAYLAGRAHLLRGDVPAAAAELERAGRSLVSASREHARVLLGTLQFRAGRFDDAVAWWRRVDSEPRAAWGVDAALRQTAYLRAVEAVAAGDLDTAVDRLDDATDDDCLRELRRWVLVRAAQALLFPEQGESDAAAKAARLLDRAWAEGACQPPVAGLLALAHRLRGDRRAAREVLRRVEQPDKDTWLQLGLLSLADGQVAAAEREFAQASQAAPQSFSCAYNLLRTRLALGLADAAREMLQALLPLAPDGERRQLLEQVLHLLDGTAPEGLACLDAATEARLLDFVCRLGHLELTGRLLQRFASVRPTAAQEPFYEARVLQARQALDRADWLGAAALARRLTAEADAAPAVRAACLNLFGVAAWLAQDFDDAGPAFAAAARLVDDDARVEQNQALAHEWRGEYARAEPHWDRYFALVDGQLPEPPGVPGYAVVRAYEGLQRLADAWSAQGRWPVALAYAGRASDLRPDDPEAVDRLYHLAWQAGRPDEARRAVERLRRLRPDDPQADLYELGLTEVRTLQGVDRLLLQVDRVRRRFPDDARVQARAQALVGDLLPLLVRLTEEVSGELGKVRTQLRQLARYQIDWAAVDDVARELRGELQRLRKVVGRCLAVLQDEERRRTLHELEGAIDRKIEQCRAVLART